MHIAQDGDARFKASRRLKLLSEGVGVAPVGCEDGGAVLLRGSLALGGVRLLNEGFRGGKFSCCRDIAGALGDGDHGEVRSVAGAHFNGFNDLVDAVGDLGHRPRCPSRG